jgi:hypothetical protein
MNLCVFTGSHCTICGAPRINARQLCGSWRPDVEPLAPPTHGPGLGDMVAAGLSAVGITKDRAQAVAQAVGLQDCGCAERQRRLNELGQKLGIGGPESTRP